MLAVIAILLVVAATVGFALYQFSRYLRLLGTNELPTQGLSAANRYRPMLRVLSDDDLNFVTSDRALRNQLRQRRREIFRDYLRCLTKDYAKLLAGVRLVMVQSNVDRPDLVAAMAKNKMLFAAALCRIELRLQLHALGLGNVDVSSLVRAIEMLRGQVNLIQAVPVAA